MMALIFGASRPTPIEEQPLSHPAASKASNPDVELVVACCSWKRYVRDSDIAKKGARGRSSWICNYGIFITEINEDLQPRTEATFALVTLANLFSCYILAVPPV